MAYLPLSTANLPDPAIDPAQGSSPSDYFNTVLYTGDGTSSRGITGLGFQPDLVWTKRRSTSDNHHLFDAVRVVSSVPQRLFPNLTNAEDGNFGSLDSFDSDGFTIGANTATNASGESFVAWNWKANGSGVSNTDGSITSTVSANTESGFSIVSYTGTGSNATVGHGLSSAPEMIIFKERNGATNWPVYHSGLSSAAYAVELNQTIAQFSYPAYFQSTDPTSSVFYIGTDTYINNNTDNYIAYCFHSVDGFSKIGSYNGDQSSDSDSNFVYLGFRPSFVMIKGTSSNSPWLMFDSARNTYNVIGDEALAANSSEAEGLSSWNPNTSNSVIDFLSNGFKIRTQSTTGINGSEVHIYMAFAENPFKYSNAR